VNKLEFVKKINEQSLNKLSGLVISSSSTHVRKKLNKLSLHIQYSTQLSSITVLTRGSNSKSIGCYMYLTA
jgi:DNA-dependent RNA polymerase auxiliary subunit epsilon